MVGQVYYLPLSSLEVSKAFKKHPPKNWKKKQCEEFFGRYGMQDRYIVLNHNNVIIDGYVMYCVLKQKKIEFAEVVYSDTPKPELNRKSKEDFGRGRHTNMMDKILNK